MKIAITATGTGLDAAVDPRFGRCACFVLVDRDSGAVETVANPFQDAAGGAGTQTAQWVVNQGVDAVLTGQCGPKATAVLEDAGIHIVEGVSGTVREAVENYSPTDLTDTPSSAEPVRRGRGYGSGPGPGGGRGPGQGRGSGGGRGPGLGRGPGGGGGRGRGGGALA